MEAGVQRLPVGLLDRRPVTAAAADRARQHMSAAASRKFRRDLLLQVFLCAVPVSLLLAMGRAELAGTVLWGIFTLIALRLVFLGKAAELLCLVVALAPLLNLLRDFAVTYQIIAVLSFLVLLFYASRARNDMWIVLRQTPLAVTLLVFALLYYAASLIFTASYEVNLRLFDLAFMVIIVLVIGRSREMLGAALLGLVVSGWAVGLSMLQHIDPEVGSRLGAMMLEGHILGNPVSLGTPLALCFLALTLDRGRWVNLQGRPLIRLLLAVPTFALLALTTSRAAWLVTAGGILIGLLFDSRARGRTLVLIGVGALVLQVVLLSPFGDGLRDGLDRTFSGERSATNRTSGRSDQWIVSYYALTSSASSLLTGYGPGMGPHVYAKYSREARGITYAVGGEAQLHALYMQIAVETGLLGLVPFVVWLGIACFKNFRWMLKHGSILPLVCLLGYLIIIGTVSGNDSVSGTFLGIGLLTTMNPRTPKGLARRRAMAQTGQAVNPRQTGHTHEV
jgi:O-antigen ligase